MAHIDRTMCKACGTWYWQGDAHTCPTASLTTGLPTPTDLPVERAGVTVRYHVADDLSIHLRAVLKHEPAPLIGATA